MNRPNACRLLTVLIATLLVDACTSGPATSRAPSPVLTVLEVQNRHWEDVTIFVVQGDVPIALGAVPAMRSRGFRIPNAYLGSGLALRLAAEAFGSRERHASEIMHLVPGNRIEWVVESRMKYSSVMIR